MGIHVGMCCISAVPMALREPWTSTTEPTSVKMDFLFQVGTGNSSLVMPKTARSPQTARKSCLLMAMMGMIILLTMATYSTKLAVSISSRWRQIVLLDRVDLLCERFLLKDFLLFGAVQSGADRHFRSVCQT